MKPLGGRIPSAALLLILLQVFSPVHAQYRGGGRQSNCTTYRSTPGNCIAINMCPELLQIITERKSEDHNILRMSHCGFSGQNPLICCPILTTLNTNPNLPTMCGEDLTQKIVGGQLCDLYEFPWMVLLEYTKPNGRTTACGGVLISKRYVLTAAHCVKGKDLPTNWELVNVRFGEYDTTTDHDCIPDSPTSIFCMDEPVNIGIEEQITHEDYDPQGEHHTNDIALLRLTRDVTFTNYIRPICLPSNVQQLPNFFYVAGWGKTETRSESNVKLKVRVPLANFNACANTYRSSRIQLSDGQFCAGGQEGRDSCRGDSGGPLMAFTLSNTGTIQWTVYGIVSFGPTPCGTRNWPGIYTNVPKYVPWILSKIRP